jgi:hypothetical protein
LCSSTSRGLHRLPCGTQTRQRARARSIHGRKSSRCGFPNSFQAEPKVIDYGSASSKCCRAFIEPQPRRTLGGFKADNGAVPGDLRDTERFRLGGQCADERQPHQCCGYERTNPKGDTGLRRKPKTFHLLGIGTSTQELESNSWVQHDTLIFTMIDLHDDCRGARQLNGAAQLQKAVSFARVHPCTWCTQLPTRRPKTPNRHLLNPSPRQKAGPQDSLRKRNQRKESRWHSMIIWPKRSPSTMQKATSPDEKP